MDKKKISCSYALLVIILFAALAFVTVYAYVQDKTRTCSCPKCSENVVTDNSCNTNAENNNQSSSVVTKDIAHNNKFGKVIVSKDGSVYFEANENYTFNFSNDFVKGSYNVDDYILGPEFNQLEGYKLNTSNIRSASSFDVGNGGAVISVVLITRDNKVEIIYFNNSNGNNVDVTFKKVDNLSNIVSVVESSAFGGHGYVYYDVNGNQINN